MACRFDEDPENILLFSQEDNVESAGDSERALVIKMLGFNRWEQNITSFSGNEQLILFFGRLSVRFCAIMEIPAEPLAFISFFKMIRMLHLCGYDSADIIVVLALTLDHHTLLKPRISAWGSEETVYVVLLEAFIAHCYVMDECCPLVHWYANLFSGYCSGLSELNLATTKLLQFAYCWRLLDVNKSLSIDNTIKRLISGEVR